MAGDCVGVILVLITLSCLAVLFVWQIYQEVVIADLKKFTGGATTTAAATTTTTSTSAGATTAPTAAPTAAPAAVHANVFQKRIAQVRRTMIDPLLQDSQDQKPKEQQQQKPKEQQEATEEQERKRSPTVAFPYKVKVKVPVRPEPIKSIFHKQVQPEKVKLSKPLDVNTDDTRSSDSAPAAAPRTEEDRSERAALAMAANEIAHKSAASAQSESAAGTDTKKPAPLSLQERIRARAMASSNKKA